MSYFGFDKDVYYTSEDLGTVRVNVTRYGSLKNDVSVLYSTEDLTANADEDYKPGKLYCIYILVELEIDGIFVISVQ